MKGSLLTLLVCHVLFLQSFAAQHWSRHASKNYHLAQGNLLDGFVGSTYPQVVKRATAATLDTIKQRRIGNIISGQTGSTSNISAWVSSLDANGKWPDSEVDYTTGCLARRANWPAQVHWIRIVLMSAAWYGGLPGADQFVNDVNLRAAISRAIDYWYGRDFTNQACLSQGGTPSCPCDNPGNLLWNTNWFSNVILIPKLVGQAFLLLGDTLTASQLNHSTYVLSRSYTYTGMSFTGANALDVSRIGMDQALQNGDSTLLANAYQRSHVELVIQNAVSADGIRADGAFGQHAGMLYNGNYGKDYSADILFDELEAAGTEFAANAQSQAAFGTLFDGNRWMIFRNVVTGVLHWDYSVLGRFISFPVADNQATANIKTNLTAVGELGQQWNSKPLIDFATSLKNNTSNANAGSLQGNRMFYTNDYMVQRGPNYVSTLKMWSSRTSDSECLNSQNPFSFHLADGASYNYVRGDEYEDTFAVWDWNLIPGITVDYGNTPLTCQNSGLLGIESFVGGVSAEDGSMGLSAMRYTNPKTRALSWQKAWFFLADDVQHVMISGLSSTSSAPVRSVLDQRRARGPAIVNGRSTFSGSRDAGCKTLWHGDVGYTFGEDSQMALTVQLEQKTGNWSKIGTSVQPPVTIDMFTAYVEHDRQALNVPVEYSVFPGVDYETFVWKSASRRVKTVQNDAHISAVLDGATFMGVFWDAAGGVVTFELRGSRVTVAVDAHAVVIYQLESGNVTVSDPSQSLGTVRVTVTRDESQTLTFQLPSGGIAGSGVTQYVQQWASRG
ncbi:polysaccharide lyase family 8 protein [Tricholoma matsutake]|nr:polysaccharide lyase family 8 protein [Tricholoma matsutake 945]